MSGTPLASRLRALLPGGRLVRGATVLAGSNAVGQVIAVLASPLLTRLYSPADFGLLAVYMSLTTVLGVLISMRYELAIALPRTEREARAVMFVAFGFVAISTVLGVIAVALARERIAHALNAPELADLLLALPVSIALLGTFTVFRYWCLRVGAFAPIGRARLRQVCASLVVQIVGFRYGAAALVGGQIANQGAGTLSLGRIASRGGIASGVRWVELRHALVRYRRFPLISSWAALLNRCGAEMPSILFVVFFGPTTAGLYALAMRILNVPAGVVTGAIASVFLSSAAERAREGRLGDLVERMHGLMSMLALPSLALVAVTAPEIFRVVFGPEWREAGEMARWIVILVYFAVVASPLTMLFAVLERQGEDLLYQVTMFVARAASIVVGGTLNDPLLTVALFCVTSGLCNVAFLVWVASRVDIPLASLARPTAIAALVAAASCAPALLGEAFAPDSTIRLLSFGLSAVVTALVALSVVRRSKILVRRES